MGAWRMDMLWRAFASAAILGAMSEPPGLPDPFAAPAARPIPGSLRRRLCRPVANR